MIIFKQYDSLWEAELAKDILHQHDIQAVVNSAGLRFTLASTVVDLLVDEKDKERALHTLSRFEDSELAATH